MSKWKHTLIVGGTGMLRPVTSHLAKHSENVSVLARNAQNACAAHHCYPLCLNYEKYDLLKEQLLESVSEYGPIEMAICWIHSTAPEAPYIIAELLEDNARYIHVLGSANANPSAESKERKKRFSTYQKMLYQEVILGFVVENDHSRWLTNEEISRGVIRAIENREKKHIVGTVTPWSQRP